jgi:hypothetical protein
MKKSPDTSLDDETAMRTFYEMCGVSQKITEAAIKMRREHPVELEKKALSIKYGGPQNKRNERSGT